MNIIITAIVSFIALVILLRISGKRTLTKMNAFDFIITLAIGSTISATITSDSTSVAEGITALSAIIFIQYAIAWLEVRSNWFQKLIKANPSVVFYEGEFQDKTMMRERLSKVEVLAAMRYNGLSDPSEALLVLLETDGQLSVIPKKERVDDMGVLQTVESFSPKKGKE